ncbi:TonB family protein [candidate division KSB1 bacterium]|nr:TonB family protein [candidate division KSB1 bacterium]
MAKTYKPLVLNIAQAGQARQFVVREGGEFTVGQRGDNDLTLYGQRFPKKHKLFAQRNGGFFINVRPYIDGEISLDGSTISIKEIMLHELLSKKGEDYPVKLSPRKRGYILVGDAKIDFEFKQVVAKPSSPPPSFNMEAFSWQRAALKSLKSDLLFKAIFLILMLLNAFIIYAFKDFKVNLQAKFDIEKMPQRLAKFIIKPPEITMETDTNSLSSAMDDSQGENEKKKEGEESSNQKGDSRKSSGGKRGGNPAASAGLLGLLAGSGESGNTSSIVDALVDKGLVADLNSIVGGGTHLKVAPGNGKGNADPLDQLIGTGGSGGIDDFLSAMEEDVPQVKLNKKAKVDLVKPSKMTGSAEALGRRTDESVMQVVLSRQGRITYLYEKYLKRNPNLRGKISIEFTISANGFVASARIIESTINHPELEQDILNLIKHLKFDPIPTGDVTTIFPFQFSNVN